MTSLSRIWIYNMFKPKITVWLKAWLNHNSVSENLSDKNFFMVVTFIVQVKLHFEVSNLGKHFPSSEVKEKKKMVTSK